MDDWLRNHRQGLFLAYNRMFRRYRWQWFVTLTVKYEYDSMMKIRRMLFSWLRKLQKTEHIQVTMVYIICEKGKHQHIHLLMSGRGKLKGEIITLANVNLRKWVRQWFSLTGSFATIKKIKNQAKACRYLALHTFKKKCTEYELDFYNLKLLKKIDIQRPLK